MNYSKSGIPNQIECGHAKMHAKVHDYHIHFKLQLIYQYYMSLTRNL